MVENKIAEISHHMTPKTMESFVTHEIENGASKNLIMRFKGAVKAIYTFLPDDKILTKERLLEWRKSMEDNNYASMTILNYVKYINRYLDYTGCSELRFNRGRAKDIRDMTFGLLTAIEPTGEKNRGDIVWRCRCECGNVVELPATRLLCGNTSSCGCLQTKMRKEIFKKANKCFAGTNLTQAIKEQVISTRNKSGYVGVFPKRDKWTATLKYKGKLHYLGTFYNIEDAIKARARAKELAIEDAKGLLDFYEELHKNDPEIYKREYFEAPEFPKSAWVEKNGEPASAALRSDNTSGHVGVYHRNKKWEARICYQGLRYILGRFDSIDEAILARKTAEKDLKKDPPHFIEEYSKKYASYHI